MDILQMETPELIETLQEIPTSLLLRMTYERVIDISIRTEDEDVGTHCENIAEEINMVVANFDIEEAKALIAYKRKSLDAARKEIFYER